MNNHSTQHSSLQEIPANIAAKISGGFGPSQPKIPLRPMYFDLLFGNGIKKDEPTVIRTRDIHE